MQSRAASSHPHLPVPPLPPPSRPPSLFSRHPVRRLCNRKKELFHPAVRPTIEDLDSYLRFAPLSHLKLCTISLISASVFIHDIILKVGFPPFGLCSNYTIAAVLSVPLISFNFLLSYTPWFTQQTLSLCNEYMYMRFKPESVKITTSRVLFGSEGTGDFLVRKLALLAD